MPLDFSIIYELRNKRYWWIDVLLYFFVSVLIATIFCYLIFIAKAGIVSQNITQESSALQTVGTDQQKTQQTEVLSEQKKIDDFNTLFTNHSFASNVFAFMQDETLPYIWFKQFILDQKNSDVQLFGETDNMDDLSRQVANFEQSDYVQKVGVLSSTVSPLGKIDFSLDLTLDPKIFQYAADLSIDSSLLATTSSGSAAATATSGSSGATSTPQTSQDSITVFDFSLNPEVMGQINQSTAAINLNVPFGTDVTNLQPFIVASPEATVSPSSGAVQNFMDPVIYQVTGQDGSTQNYTATVTVSPKAAPKSAQSSIIGILLAVGLVIVIIVALIAVIVYRRLTIKKPTL